MAPFNSLVAEEGVITGGTSYVDADNPAQALMVALDYLDSFAERTHRIVSIEAYTVTIEYRGRYKIVFT